MSAPLGTLYDHGAHFVLCDGKRPIWKRWQQHRPTLEVVEHHADHGRSIGIVPASIGTSALDVDHGDPAALFELHPARAVVPSRRAGGRHGYYDDAEKRGNDKWAALGASGEVRSSRGFLVLYDNAPEKLAAALTRPGRYPFPDSLFEAAGVPLPILHKPVEQGPAPVARAPRVLPMLEVIAEGARNATLFDVVRWWSYSQDRGRVLAHWYDAVRERALQHNERFADPLPAPEVRKLAYNVASWTWSGHGAFDHSPTAQSRRAVKLGKLRRAAVADRDREIVQDRAEGMSLRALARKHGCEVASVRWTLARDAPLMEQGAR